MDFTDDFYNVAPCCKWGNSGFMFRSCLIRPGSRRCDPYALLTGCLFSLLKLFLRFYFWCQMFLWSGTSLSLWTPACSWSSWVLKIRTPAPSPSRAGVLYVYLLTSHCSFSLGFLDTWRPGLLCSLRVPDLSFRLQLLNFGMVSVRSVSVILDRF